MRTTRCLALAALLLAAGRSAAAPIVSVGYVAAVPTADGEPMAWGGQVTAGWALASIDGSKLLSPRLRWRGFPRGPQSVGAGVQLLYSPNSDDPVGYVAFTGEVARWTGCFSGAWCGTAFEAEVEAGVRLPLERGRSAMLGLACAARAVRPFWPPPLVLPQLVGGFSF